MIQLNDSSCFDDFRPSVANVDLELNTPGFKKKSEPKTKPLVQKKQKKNSNYVSQRILDFVKISKSKPQTALARASSNPM